MRNHTQDVLNFILGTGSLIWIINPDICGSNQDITLEVGVDEHNPPVQILKKDFMIADRFPQLRMFDN